MASMTSTNVTTLNISIPKPMRAFINKRVAEADYGTPSDYLRSLVRADRKRRAEEKFRTLMLEGFSSPAKNYTKKDWNVLRKDILSDVSPRKAA